MPQSSRTLQLNLLVLLLATTTVLGRLISLPATAMVAWRTFLAMLGMGLWLMIGKKAPVRIPPALACKFLGVGGVIGMHWLLLFASVQVSNISIGLTGMASISLFTAFTEPLMEGRRIRRHEILLGLLVLGGLALVAGVESSHRTGLFLALGAALLAAIFPVMNRKLVLAHHSPETMLFWEMPGACVVALLAHPLFFPVESLWQWRGLDWFWLLILALVCTVFAHAYHIHLLKKTSAYTSNLAMNLEPVYGILFGTLLFHENKSLHPAFYIGSLTIIVANMIHIPLARRLTREP